MSLNEQLEIANKITSLITSICFLVGIIWASSIFKYKIDTDTKNLYVKNCEKVFKALQQLTNRNTSQEIIEQLRQAKYEAEIHFHKEIFEFVNELFEKAIDLQSLRENTSKNAEEEAKLLLYFSSKLRETNNFYRKFIVKESFSIKSFFAR